MGDIYCAKCGEPWDAYGVRHGDMERDAADKFLRGRGCPHCDFGKQCVSCGGTGKERAYGGGCPTCMGLAKVLARRLCSDTEARWNYGYVPNVKRVPVEAEEGFMRALRPLRESRDGLFEEAWFRCWDCQPGPCEECGGDGELHRAKDCHGEDLDLAAARSEVEESAEEPMGILARRGLL